MKDGVKHRKLVCQCCPCLCGCYLCIFVQGDNADFVYIDVWSSKFTWNGTEPPREGELVVIPKEMTVLLDQDTPVLKVLLIQGQITDNAFTHFIPPL